MTYRTTCRICPPGTDAVGRIDPKDSPRDIRLIPFLDLGQTPLADSFVADPNAPEYTAPLRVGVCPSCWCVQLMDIVDDARLFGDEYAFFTGASPSSIAYFADYAAWVLDSFPKEANGLIVEIASNDGTLLAHFKRANRRVLGIEPAANTAKIAQDAGIETITRPFSLDLALQGMKNQPKAAIIIANNVLAHVDSLHDFVGGIACLLEDDGVALLEVQYLPELLAKNAFDHVYHEHRSYFSLRPLRWLLRLHYLEVVDVLRADTQGGSIRLVVRKDPYRKLPVVPAVEEMDRSELAMGLDRAETYLGLQDIVETIRDELRIILKELRYHGKTIHGFGASAKGNTLLNFCRIGPDLLDCIVDTTPHKIGKYTPGTHIPVVAPGDRPEPDYYLLLVWNYLKGVLKREQAFRDAGGKFIVPVPEVRIL